jgi:transcriptional regulator of acetoin/glycerol metabolism
VLISAIGDSSVSRIWERFVCGHNSGLQSLRPVVRESWLRCREHGVDIKRKTAPSELSSAELNGYQRDNPLFEGAAPLLRMVLKAFGDAPVLVSLADARGRLLESIGSGAAGAVAEEINAIPGSRWTEEQMGTDAVPTCLAVDGPVQISGFENYIEAFHDWAGNAAPIHDPFTNKLVGAVGLYGYRAVPNPRGLELAVDLAAAIERFLATKEIARRHSVFEQYEHHLRRFPGDALLGVSRAGSVLVASPGALTRLGVAEPEPGRRLSLIEHFGLSEEFFESEGDRREIRLRTRAGELLSATLLPVSSDRDLAGFVAILDGIKRWKKRAPSHNWPARYTFADLIGESPALQRCIARARRIARQDGPVLITGEPGTGKELLAHAIHDASERSAGPFIPINCGGLNDDLLGAELFGYVDGAFTGASRGGRIGKFELADGGTILLDEAEAMSPALQAHLLRAIEEGRITRLGGDRPITVNVRVMAATNVDLESLTLKGGFRRDLFDRLSCLGLEAPPLRQRRGDLARLTEHFLQHSGSAATMSPAALERLESYCWPGNVRQLRNVLNQAISESTTGVIDERDLPNTVCGRACRTGNQCPYAKEPRGGVHPQGFASDSERDFIIKMLADCRGNISKTAAYLGLHRVSLYRKMKKYQIVRNYD